MKSFIKYNARYGNQCSRVLLMLSCGIKFNRLQMSNLCGIPMDNISIIINRLRDRGVIIKSQRSAGSKCTEYWCD